MKAIYGILIGAGVLFTGRYLYNLNRAQNKVAVQLGGRIHKITLTGIEVMIDYNIKNPSQGSMEMAIPLIKLSHGGTLIAASSLSDAVIPDTAQGTKGRIKILAGNETGIITSKITLPYLSLVGVGANLVATMKDRLNGGTKKVKLTVEINTTIFTQVANFAYDDKQVIEL